MSNNFMILEKLNAFNVVATLLSSTFSCKLCVVTAASSSLCLKRTVTIQVKSLKIDSLAENLNLRCMFGRARMRDKRDSHYEIELGIAFCTHSHTHTHTYTTKQIDINLTKPRRRSIQAK